MRPHPHTTPRRFVAPFLFFLANHNRRSSCATTGPLTLTPTLQELHDSDFGKREEVHKIKRAKRAADVQHGSLTAAVP